MSTPAAAGSNGHGGPVFDLAAEAAAQAADRKPFRFIYKKHQYAIPAQEDWPVDALVALGAGDLESALPQLLGDKAFGDLRKAGLTVGEMNLLFDKIATRSGVDLKNSSPPRPRVSTRT